MSISFSMAQINDGGIILISIPPGMPDTDHLWSSQWQFSDNGSGKLCMLLTSRSGNAIVTQWFPNFLRTAGVPNDKVLFYNSLDPVLCFIAALVYSFFPLLSQIGTLLVDRRGRRPLIFYVTLSLSVLWAVIVATTAVFKESDEQNKHAANASIAIIYIFRIVYSFGYTPMQALWPVECLKFEVLFIRLLTLISGPCKRNGNVSILCQCRSICKSIWSCCCSRCITSV